jgi:sugar (pentulose or hexulose) kinase
LGAHPSGRIVSAGGGSTSAVWNAIRATVLGADIEARPAASTALGACILAASGTLHPDLATATRAMSATGTPVRPAPDEQKAMDAGYLRFKEELAQRGCIDNRR